jgi:hypothetical protein
LAVNTPVAKPKVLIIHEPLGVAEYPSDSSYTCICSSALRFPHQRNYNRKKHFVARQYATNYVNFIVKLIGQLFNDAVYPSEAV